MADIDSLPISGLETTTLQPDNMNQDPIIDSALRSSELEADNAAGEGSANGTPETSKPEEVPAVYKHEAQDHALGLCEIQKVIAVHVARDSSPVTRDANIMNLRLVSKLWENAITVESPEVKQSLFRFPIPTTGLPVYPRPESLIVPLPKGNLLLSDHYRTNAGLHLAIKAVDVQFNTVCKHILFRFRAQLPGAYPRVHDMVKVKLGDKKPFTSFWFWITNQSARHDLYDPENRTAEVNVKTNLRSKFGRTICDQYISQPPVREIKVTFLSESPLFEGYRWVVKVSEPTGVRVWHVLQALLDGLVPEGTAGELRDLYQNDISKTDINTDLGDLPPLPDDSDEDLREPSTGSDSKTV
ncbi:hypothetical protein BKA80DRAFT_344801 [Phyllosticta citrichinensis]